jgi:hypothetical protein
VVSRVFITHTTGRVVDFSEAEQYGTLIHVFPVQIYPDQFEERIPLAIERVSRVLKIFDPERDYLLLSGDPMLTLLAGMVLGKQHDRVTALHWDRQAARYFPVELNLKEATSDQGPSEADLGDGERTEAAHGEH